MRETGIRLNVDKAREWIREWKTARGHGICIVERKRRRWDDFPWQEGGWGAKVASVYSPDRA